MMSSVELGRVGVWWSGSWRTEAEPGLDVAAELEALGFGAIWSTGGFNPGLSSRFSRLLASTSSLAVASGIVNIWKASPEELAPPSPIWRPASRVASSWGSVWAMHR